MAWLVKTRALTAVAAVDETELEPEGLAELALDDTGTADTARAAAGPGSERGRRRRSHGGRAAGPGTSFKRPLTSSGPSPAVRPMSKSGRPVTGFVRPATGARPATTLEGALAAPRTAASRPVTSASGRYTRLGTVRGSLVRPHPPVPRRHCPCHGP